MTFKRPSLAELNERVKADFDSNIEGADVQLRYSMPGIDAGVHAGVSHELHGAVEAQERRLLPMDGHPETVLKWAGARKMRRLPATFASGEATHSDAENGNVIAEGRRYQAGNGQVYIAQSDATVAGGSVTVSLVAEKPGIEANLESGARLSLVSPVSGIPAQAIVGSDGIQGGEEQESIEALNDRVMFEWQNPPRGGSDNDYIRWARRAHPSVTRVFVTPHEFGPGTVVVRFTTDNQASVIPAPQIVDIVKAYIVQRAPSDARNIFVFAPRAVPKNIDITDLSPNTQAVQLAIKDELNDLFRRDAVPQKPVADSKIGEAISVARGEEQHEFTATGATLAVGDIEVLGVVSVDGVAI